MPTLQSRLTFLAKENSLFYQDNDEAHSTPLGVGAVQGLFIVCPALVFRNVVSFWLLLTSVNCYFHF